MCKAFGGTEPSGQAVRFFPASFTSHLPEKLRRKCLGLYFEANQPASWLCPNTVIESDNAIFKRDDKRKKLQISFGWKAKPISADKVEQTEFS